MALYPESSPDNADQVELRQRKLLKWGETSIFFARLGVFQHHGKRISSSRRIVRVLARQRRLGSAQYVCRGRLVV